MSSQEKIRKEIQPADNRGITLVEIIISLLILMIIVVPLISSFVSASGVAANSRKKMYAADLADNVMETVKNLGVEKTAFQFYAAPADFLLGEGTALTYKEDETGGDGPSVVDRSGNRVFVSTRKTNPYVYQMEGVQEGTGKFDVRITFSSAAYTSAPATPAAPLTPAPVPELLPNDYNYADLSAFNSASTTLINPNNSSNYDYLAKMYFQQLHSNYYFQEWEAARAIVDAANDEIYADYDEEYDAAVAAGTALPPLPNITPEPTAKPTLSPNVLDSQINKTMTIEISKETIGVGVNEKYKLNSYVNYSLNNIYNGAGIAKDPINLTISRNYSGYCDNVLRNSLNSIFVMYTPLTTASSLIKDKIIIDNQTTQTFDIYLVLQAAINTSFTSPLQVELSGSANTLRLHSQAVLNVTGTGNASTSNGDDPSERLINEVTTNNTKIYRVTIEVYEGGTSFGELLQTLSSTVSAK
ncbi:MAG: hypothetical protein K0S04_1667 [Herbinix sp.]|jgi:type II secretory pathway pseudopilin PulG|nr:hypothetical protein [Herbinix sp.]